MLSEDHFDIGIMINIDMIIWHTSKRRGVTRIEPDYYILVVFLESLELFTVDAIKPVQAVWAQKVSDYWDVLIGSWPEIRTFQLQASITWMQYIGDHLTFRLLSN